MTLSKQLIVTLSICSLMTSCDKVKSIVDDVTGGDKPKERVVGRRRVQSAGPDTLDKWKAEPNVLVVVDFYSDSCGPCKALSPSLDAMASKYGDKAVILKVNVDRNSSLAQEYGVKGIPDVRYFLNGEEIAKFVGTKTEKQLDSIFAEYTGEIDDDLPIAEREEIKEPVGPITVQREKGYLPPGVERAKLPEEMKGHIQIESPAKQAIDKKPVVDMGPPPTEEKPGESK